MEESVSLGNEMAQHHPKIIKGIREVIDTVANMSLEEAIAYEYQVYRAHNGAKDLSVMNEMLHQMRMNYNRR